MASPGKWESLFILDYFKEMNEEIIRIPNKNIDNYFRIMKNEKITCEYFGGCMMGRVIQQIAVIFFLILFLAALPMTLKIDSANGTVQWDIEAISGIYSDFLKDAAKGSLGTYQLGYQERPIAADIGDNFFTSLSIVFAAVIAAIVVSITFTIFIGRYRAAKGFHYILNLLSVIPDFILIILALALAVNFYKWTGIRVISLRPDGGALYSWFPMMVVAIAPTIYLFKSVALKYYDVSGEDYIRTAVAKGFGTNYINVHHVFKNIEPFIFAEMPKVVSLTVGNLFIVEYLLNVSGITKFIFQSTNMQPIAVGLFALLIISLLVLVAVKLLFFIFKRGFIHA